ncbi:U-box domain-containing protein 44 isoform X2 [Morus notabilis]|uniref:U-box domain-containing protein 44 isoform X2 n=1 Tax=Morus notabilis TaxID=981085 RepID=UPI000CED6C34|nr:U-box domain-containing protein 44 isoform X2 [Morus notabilis]
MEATPLPTLKTFPNQTNPFPHADPPLQSLPSTSRRKMTSESSFPSFSAAVDSVQTSLSYLCSDNDNNQQSYSSNVTRRFSGFAHRLQLATNHLLRSSRSPDYSDFPPSVHTALRGIAGDLASAGEMVRFYRTKSKTLVLVNCVSLCASIQERTLAISRWLNLLDSAIPDLPDLRKKIADLSTDMKQANFKVTENEERVHCTLQKEGQRRQTKTSKAVESAIVMDLARALGVDPENHAVLSEQIKLLKNDVAQSRSVSERRILSSLERIMENWSTEPTVATWKLDIEFEDDAHISPFKNFICPLTKEVMKEPVVLESSQTYERAAIEYWFERCLEDGRDPTCPVTGQVLGTLELKPNIGLAGAIEEWLNRNVEIQVKIAVQNLGEEPPSVDFVERVLDNVYKISEEHPVSRYKFRNAGIVELIVKLLRNSSKSIGTNLRSKCLLALLSMAKDEESKRIMLEDGTTKLAIHSLMASSEKERECAVKLLLEFGSDEACCIKIASEKGALLLLSSMSGNLEHPALSNLAEQVLKRMEKAEDNIMHLAAAGRFEPLLNRLCEALTDILSRNQDTSSESKELAALIMANIVSNPGHWELASADKEGHSMQSESIVYSLLALLLEVSSRYQASILQILCGIASSPQASEPVASHIKSGGGVGTILSFLEHPEVENRKYAFRLSRVLSERFGQDLVHDLRASNKLTLFRDRLLDNQYKGGERSDAARILANLSLSEDEVKVLLGADFVRWAVNTLETQCRNSKGRVTEHAASMLEGLLGILLHFTRSIDLLTLQTVRENSLMTIFCEQLCYPSKPRVKQLAAVGLKNLSECGRQLAARDSEPQPPQGFCSSLVFMCGRASSQPSMCPIHSIPCEEESQWCLLKSNCIKPLVELLTDEDTVVQIAAIEALSTLVMDTSSSFKRAADELERLGVINGVIDLFIEARSDELQEKTIWIIERILRVENHNQPLSLNQALVRALVEAFRRGNPNTKRHAQDALTNLKQLSGVSGKASIQIQSRR